MKSQRIPKDLVLTRMLLSSLWMWIGALFRRTPPTIAYVQRPPQQPNGASIKPRSVFIRHLDCGSCNGCELELNALSNPIYDAAQYGIHFEASPRHADVLAMTGAFTRNLEDAAEYTLGAMPEPRIITIGDCAKDGGVFSKGYATKARPDGIEAAIVAHVPGCPPSPQDVLGVLLNHDVTGE